MKRVAIYGTVMLEGTPLDAGTLTLLPVDGDSPAVNCAIRQGEYAFDKTNGPVAGLHRVLIMPDVDLKTPYLPTPGQPKRSRARKEPLEWEQQVDIPRADSFEHNIALE